MKKVMANTKVAPKLTKRQRVVLLDMANNGGLAVRTLEWEDRVVLLNLGFVEERPYSTPKQQAANRRELDRRYKALEVGAKRKRASELLRGLIYAIEKTEHALNRKGFWLTPAARAWLSSDRFTPASRLTLAAGRAA